MVVKHQQQRKLQEQRKLDLKKKSGILKGGVLMYDNQRKKELKKEYAPFLPA